MKNFFQSAFEVISRRIKSCFAPTSNELVDRKAYPMSTWEESV